MPQPQHTTPTHVVLMSPNMRIPDVFLTRSLENNVNNNNINHVQVSMYTMTDKYWRQGEHDINNKATYDKSG